MDLLDTRGEVKDWVSNYTENLVKTGQNSLVFEITRAYAKERGDLSSDGIENPRVASLEIEATASTPLPALCQ
jgi:hypothetical protein